MTNKIKISLAAAALAALVTPALAQDEWIVDSGRYVNGQVPSYTATQTFHAPRASQLIEGRNAAIVQSAPLASDRATVLGN
jgi:hypothetical protein